MDVLVKVMLVDPENSGFIGRLTVEPQASPAARHRITASVNDATMDAWYSATRHVENLLTFVDRTLDQPGFTVTESDISKSFFCLETLEGKSIGVAFFCGLLAAGLGWQVRSDVAITGCLENDGRISSVHELKQKLTGEYGAQSDLDLRCVLIPPPPTSATPGHVEPDQEHRQITGAFKKERPDVDVLVLSHIKDLFEPGIFQRVFDVESILTFVLRYEFLDYPERIKPARDSVSKSFIDRLLQIIEDYWVITERILSAGSSFLDPADGDQIELFRQVLLRFAENRDTRNLQGLLTVTGQNLSSEHLLMSYPLEYDLETIFCEHYANHVDEAYRQGEQEIQYHLKHLSKKPTVSDLANIVENSFPQFKNLCRSMFALLECYLELYPPLAHRLYSSTSIFRIAYDRFSHAAERIGQSKADVSTVCDYLLYGDIAGRAKDFDQNRIGWLQLNDGNGEVRLKPGLPAMTIVVQPDLSELEFVIDQEQALEYLKGFISRDNRDEFAVRGNNVIKKPVLLWEESSPKTLCEAWRSANYSPDNCRLSQLPDGQPAIKLTGQEEKLGLIQLLFARCPMLICSPISGDGKPEVLWALDYKWPPSIDSLWFVSVLSEHGFARDDVKSVADIGSGTGFLGISAAVLNPHIKQLWFSDVSKMLIKLTEYNVERNLAERNATGLKVGYVTGRGVRPFQDISQRDGKFDLIMSAPPYLPCVEQFGIATGLSAAISGTHLLVQLVEMGKTIAKRLLIQFSVLAMPEFSSACRQARVDAHLWASTKVPLRIPPIAPWHPEHDLHIKRNEASRREYQMADNEYRQLLAYNRFLQKERGLEELNRNNFRWWHEIRIYEIQFD